MIAVRNAEERGHLDFGWLDTRHSFSFGNYYDPSHMGFRHLRVINEDRVQAAKGFDTHPHRDMEIITYVLEGALEHRDSMGNGSVIRPGEVQRMTAGTGITHSEYNHSKSDSVHLLQIWILPQLSGLAPGYEQKAFPEDERRGRLRLVASQDGREGSVTVHQDVALYATLLSAGDDVSHPLAEGRHAWVQVAKGSVTVNGEPLKGGDGAAISGESHVELHAEGDAEVLLFDLV